MLGLRGLPGGSGLAQLMETLGYVNHKNKPGLTPEYILGRAQERIKANGRWPGQRSGAVEGGYPGDTWRGYDQALKVGLRGLPGGSSLAQLMETIGYINHLSKPDLTPEFILERSREYREANNKWPSLYSGHVEGGHAGDTWKGYDRALMVGCRGLPGGSSLAKLLDTIRKPKTSD